MYISYIDGIRAFAVLSVFLFHLNSSWLPGGFSGVDVFFVVSGFVVSLSLDKFKDMKFLPFLTLFYSRRIKRIVPVLFFCLIITTIATVLFTSPISYSLSGINAKTAFFAFFGLSNIIMALGHNDYFAPTMELNPFAHTWSLGVEEQFYFIFPYIFFLWAQTRSKRLQQASTIIFITLLFASLATAYYYSHTNKVYEYYMIFSRFWELAVGILIYQFFKKGDVTKIRKYQKILKILSVLSLCLVVTGFIVCDPINFPMPWAFLPVLGTAGLIFSLHYIDSNIVKSILDNRVLRYIGKISYSLYLWHWPVIVIFRWTVGANTYISYILIVVITFILSALSYYFIENKFRFAPFFSKIPKYAVVAAGLVLIFAGAFATKYMFTNSERISLSVTKDKEIWLPYSYKQNFTNGECEVESKRIANFASNPYGFKIEFFCKEPTKRKPRNIMLLGDSHAAAYQSLLRRYTAETGESTSVYSTVACGDIFNTPMSEPLSNICSHFLDEVISEIKGSAKPGDILMISYLTLLRFNDQWVINNEIKVQQDFTSGWFQEQRRKALIDNMALFQELAQYGIKIVIEAPKPIFYSPAYLCSDWFNKNNSICAKGLKISKMELLQYREPIILILDEVMLHNMNVSVFDPFYVLCPGEECSAVDKNGKPIFLDGDHISGYGNMVLFDSFKQYMSLLQ